MNVIWDELRDEFSANLPDGRLWVRISFRLLLALILSGIIGWERERGGKAAGLRTHILVALGSAIFVLAVSENGATPSDMARAVQGIATGIGFIGGGVILKLEERRRVKGLTTAGSIWLAAAVGVAAGLGRAPVAILGTLFCWVVLSGLYRLEKHLSAPDKKLPLDKGKQAPDKEKPEATD